MIRISLLLRFTRSGNAKSVFQKGKSRTVKHGDPFPFSLVISSGRTAGRRIRQAVTTGFLLTVWLASTAPSALGQSCTQPVVSANDPNRTVLPVHFDASNGNITVGSTTWCGKNPGFHLLALSRQPDNILQPDGSHLLVPHLLSDAVYTDAGSVNTALGNLQKQYGDPLVMVNAVGGYGITISDLAVALNYFGAWPDLAQVKGSPPFIFIGSGNRNPKTALQRGGSTNNLDGYLAQDPNTNYAFVRTDFIRYDITTTDGTIKVGNNTYTTAGAKYKYAGCDAAGSNSFHLVIVDRESPNKAPLADNLYCTRANPGAINDLATDLSGITTEGALVFIATNGTPIPTDWAFTSDGDPRGYYVAKQTARLGGYWETIVYLTQSDTYALVGAPEPPPGTPNPRQRARESSTVYPANKNGKKPAGDLHGVLSRGRGNLYSPLNADTTGLTNLGLYDILASAPTSFPAFTGDQLTAYQTINTALKCGGGNCVRNAYSDLNLNLGTTFYTPLSVMLDPKTNANCNDTTNAGLPFCQVRAQLLMEIGNAANVHELYNNLSLLWSAQGTVTLSSQLGAYDDVKSTLPAPPTASAPSLVRPLVGLFLGLATEVPVVGPAFGLADLFFSFATELATDPQGNQQIDLTSTIAKLENQAGDQFVAQGNATGTLFQSILEDYGKLSALGTLLVGQSSAGSPWYWNASTTSQVLTALKPAIQQAAYESIMPAAYAIGSYVPNTSRNCSGNGPWPVWGQFPLWQQPNAYVVLDGSFTGCSSGGVLAVQAFNVINAYVPYTYPTDQMNPYASNPTTSTILADNAWLGISAHTSPSNSGTNGRYDPPDASVLSTLFTPTSQSGLGVYRPAFFEGWPFPRVTCQPSYGVPVGVGTSIGGCDWASAKPVEQGPAPGPPQSSISLRATQIAKNGTQTDVRLSLFNSGNIAARSIELTSISLGTLAGSGQATLQSPAVPIRINGLAVGDSVNVIVKLNIPTGITKLGITEQVSVDFGQPTPTRFSAGQVLYPGK